MKRFMKWNRKNERWQHLLEEETRRLTALPPEELRALKNFTLCKISNAFNYGLWHLVQTKSITSEPEKTHAQAQINHAHGIVDAEHEIHCFVLQAQRKWFLGIYQNYLAGFALDSADQIVPIADDILYSYD